MNAKETVLLILSGYGGSVAGKTMLQKVGYFVDVVLDLDLRFNAHYYGPYSPVIEQAIAELKSLEFITEQRIGFGVANSSGFGELKRFDYRLTQDGDMIVAHILKKQKEEAQAILDLIEKIRSAGDPDYISLSIAAKSFFILRKQERAMAPGEIILAAKGFDWKLREEDIEKALALLQKLDLVTLS